MLQHYKLEIREVEYAQIAAFKGKAAKERVVIDDKTKYWAAFIDGFVVGFVGLMEIGKELRFKSAWVSPDWRGMSIYQQLFTHRMEHADKTKKFSAYCTPNSLPMYLKNGFTVHKKLERNITVVFKQNNDGSKDQL